jgi:galactose mutarotase-like enzyme
VRNLKGGRWELEVIPERGGRIASLRLDGAELLDQGIGINQPTAKNFVEGGAWGWDEMVPTVEATATLPDHGEAWRLPWSVERAAAVELSMRCRGKIVPWDLTRSIHLRDGAVAVVYTYRNAGHEPHLAYWCAHPLFRFEPGMEIGVPDGERLASIPEGTSAKAFLPKGAVDRVSLRWRSGLGVEISWDRSRTPYVGVWVCNGDLGGYHQVAIEPATGGGDRPDPAEPPPLLSPGKSLTWGLTIRPL